MNLGKPIISRNPENETAFSNNEKTIYESYLHKGDLVILTCQFSFSFSFSLF